MPTDVEKHQPSAEIRVDKWLWAARFFKTRSLASQAVEGGKIKLNEQRPKPAKTLRVGDNLLIHIGDMEWAVTVLAIADRRGPATEAQQLYRESDESRALRLEKIAERKAGLASGERSGGRPTKKERRQIIRFIRE
jgi:ribosome-associated heat shock protein Hsp15